jgi:hypothetical protein
MSKYTTCGRMVAAWLLFLPAVASAHHGIGAQFDLRTTIELEGEIRKVLWRNPHVRLTIGVTDSSGREALWEVEAQSVSMLRQKGISNVLLAVGDAVKLAGNPSRLSDTEIYVTNLLLTDGREVLFSDTVESRWSDRVLGKSGPRFAARGDASEPEKGLFRVWSRAPGTGLFANFDLDSHPMTGAASAAAAAFDPVTDLPTAKECASPEMPRIVGNPYPREFVDRGDTILMHLEEYDTVRTIHLGAVTPAAAASVSPLGYSVGRWEGDTLVVETTRVGARYLTRGIPLSEDLRILERFTPSADGSRLDYKMTVTDPSAFLEPVELDLYWIYAPDATVQPYKCTEG